MNNQKINDCKENNNDGKNIIILKKFDHDAKDTINIITDPNDYFSNISTNKENDNYKDEIRNITGDLNNAKITIDNNNSKINLVDNKESNDENKICLVVNKDILDEKFEKTKNKTIYNNVYFNNVNNTKENVNKISFNNYTMLNEERSNLLINNCNNNLETYENKEKQNSNKSDEDKKLETNNLIGKICYLIQFQ